jgi:hypothetical protein
VLEDQVTFIVEQLREQHPEVIIHIDHLHAEIMRLQALVKSVCDHVDMLGDDTTEYRRALEPKP